MTVSLPHCSAFYVAPVIAGKTDHDSWSVVWAKRWCRIQQFTVTIGRRISEATGQHTFALRLTNRGSACTLFGTPALWFEDTHGQIPFQLRGGTDQMIAATDPLPVQVRQGGSAWVVFNHYRCDLGPQRRANMIRIALSGAAYTRLLRQGRPRLDDHRRPVRAHTHSGISTLSGCGFTRKIDIDQLEIVRLSMSRG